MTKPKDRNIGTRAGQKSLVKGNGIRHIGIRHGGVVGLGRPYIISRPLE